MIELKWLHPYSYKVTKSSVKLEQILVHTASLGQNTVNQVGHIHSYDTHYS